MAVKDVINNLEEKGLHETHRIYLCGKYDLVRAERYKDIKGRLAKRDRRIDRYNSLMTGLLMNDTTVLQRKLNAALIMQCAIHDNGLEQELAEKADAVVSEMVSASADELTKEDFADWDARLLQLETKEYKVILKNLFITDLIPCAYKKGAAEPVRDSRILFLQPRKGLNQSFRYIYRVMEESDEFEPELVELKRGEVTTAEHYINALAFAREAATAKAIMLHESSEYLGYIDIRPETKVVQLWHGCGIIKKLGMSNAGKPGYKSVAGYAKFPEYNKYDIVTIASRDQRWVFEELMGKEKDDPVINPIGISRTDEFFDEAYVENCYRKLHEKIPQSADKKVILYAPTYRGKDPYRFAPAELDIAAFAEKLSDDYILIIKHHQTSKDLPEIPEKYRDTFAFDMTRGKGMDINELMTVADICISDYSSVVFEYSLFERPIIFFMYDLEEYNDSRGMYYSYEELAECGPIFKTNDEMISYIANIDKEFDRSRVAEFREKFMGACDGHSTERILDFIKS